MHNIICGNINYRLQNDHHDLTIMVPFDESLQFTCIEHPRLSAVQDVVTTVEHYFQNMLSSEELDTFKDRLSDVNRVSIMHGDNHFKLLLDCPPDVSNWGIRFSIAPMSKFLIQ